MRKKRKKKAKSLLQRISLSRGSITFKVLMAVIVIGSIALVSGVFPKSQITPPDPNAPTFKPNINSETINKDSLQLKTIDFQSCSSTVAVEMVLDRSGSMAGRKIEDLKIASQFFVSKFPDDAPVGIITFSDNIREDVAISPYKDVKARVQSTISGLRPSGRTSTYESLVRAKSALEGALPRFPNRQFALVFVSDGLPVPLTQDPRLYSPYVADEIKNMGVKIFTIGITQGLGFQSVQMRDLMTSIASPNSFFEAPNTNQLEEIYNQIGFELCKTAT